MRQPVGLLLLAAAIALEPFHSGPFAGLHVVALAGALWVLAREPAMRRGLLPALAVFLLLLPFGGGRAGEGGGSSIDGTKWRYRMAGTVQVPWEFGDAGVSLLVGAGFLGATLAAVTVLFLARERVRSPRVFAGVLLLGVFGVLSQAALESAGVGSSFGFAVLWLVHGATPLALAWEAWQRRPLQPAPTVPSLAHAAQP